LRVLRFTTITVLPSPTEHNLDALNDLYDVL
jgi:hypothetical protein